MDESSVLLTANSRVMFFLISATFSGYRYISCTVKYTVPEHNVHLLHGGDVTGEVVVVGNVVVTAVKVIKNNVMSLLFCNSV